jgi:serine protease inhibitor|tara:strand:- start:481 stop:723 length:243 start_codon:yes stop_codon:yes gene_type:complete
MRLEELSNQSSYNDNILIEGNKYTVGTNDGVTFDKVKYLGSAQMFGKKVLKFSTIENQQLTVNLSFHTFILEYNEGEENG